VGMLPDRVQNGRLGDLLNRSSAPVAETGSPGAAAASVEVRTGSPGAPTVIAFGGMAHMLMMPVAEFTQVFADLDLTVLFVKDFRQCWYQRGIRGLGDDPAAAATALLRLVPEGSALAGTVGTSAGATGAILFGALLGAPHVSAFAPRTNITRAVVREKRATGTPVPAFRIRLPYCDLRAVLLERPLPDVRIHVSAGVPADMAEVGRLRDVSGVTVIEHPLTTHTVAKTLRDQGHLTQLLTEDLGL
jgi:hypothetical protein